MNDQHEYRRLLLILCTLSFLAPYSPAQAEEKKTISPKRVPSAKELNTALKSYVESPDPTFEWKEKKTWNVGVGTVTEILMTSQTWRKIAWKHQLYLIRPASAPKNCRHALLFITGGRWKASIETETSQVDSRALPFMALAEQLKTPVAVLLQVPHQPIFGDRVEDEIIAYTFKKFVESGRVDWPLLLPMVKSAARGMDATQQYAKKHWKMDIQQFTVSGASKRGWTTWLTSAVDQRVMALAPMVIDVLNMGAQMKHQTDTWGKPSYKIDDYTELNLHELADTRIGKALHRIVDPFQYRERLVQPKLIILATNDHYWPLDALNLYWPKLQGNNRILYVPNNRHSIKDLLRLTGGLRALHRATIEGRSLPTVEPTFSLKDSADAKQAHLEVQTNGKPTAAVVWVAHSETRDFRKAKWSPQKMSLSGNQSQADVPLPQKGYSALFGELRFSDGGTYYLSTTLRIIDRHGWVLPKITQSGE